MTVMKFYLGCAIASFEANVQVKDYFNLYHKLTDDVLDLRVSISPPHGVVEMMIRGLVAAH